MDEEDFHVFELSAEHQDACAAFRHKKCSHFECSGCIDAEMKSKLSRVVEILCRAGQARGIERT
jgi:hypothetical protein